MEASSYQNKLLSSLQRVFNKDLVKKEKGCNSLKSESEDCKDNDVSYLPRLDIVVHNFDNTEMMFDKYCSFTQELVESAMSNGWKQTSKIYESNARFYLAIEIEYSGSSKHIIGDIINVCANGSLGLLITNKRNYEKAKRIYYYLLQLENCNRLQMNHFKNLIIFRDDEFLRLIKNFIDAKNYKPRL
jgi:hypothetical protein